MSRSIRSLHRQRADGGLVGGSLHAVANHLDLRGRPGGVKLRRLSSTDTPGIIPLYVANWGSLYFSTDQKL